MIVNAPLHSAPSAPLRESPTLYVVCIGSVDISFQEIAGKQIAVAACEEYPATLFESHTEASIAIIEHGCAMSQFKVRLTSQALCHAGAETKTGLPASPANLESNPVSFAIRAGMAPE